RPGELVVRQVMRHALTLLGYQLGLGRTVPEALPNGKPMFRQRYTYSFDMLGAAACTREDAQRYLEAYLDAIQRVSQASGQLAVQAPPPSISIKLSALHPRYERSQRERVWP